MIPLIPAQAGTQIFGRSTLPKGRDADPRRHVLR
jgi:hypothetical protein